MFYYCYITFSHTFSLRPFVFAHVGSPSPFVSFLPSASFCLFPLGTALKSTAVITTAEEILKQPAKVLDVLAQSLPGQAEQFVNYVIVQVRGFFLLRGVFKIYTYKIL